MFKVVASGSPWHDGSGKWDAWSFAPKERRGLVDFVFRNKKITGVVLLGGDIHSTEVHRHTGLQSEGVKGYPLYEIVASALHKRSKKLLMTHQRRNVRMDGIGEENVDDRPFDEMLHRYTREGTT